MRKKVLRKKINKNILLCHHLETERGPLEPAAEEALAEAASRAALA